VDEESSKDESIVTASNQVAPTTDGVDATEEPVQSAAAGRYSRFVTGVVLLFVVVLVLGGVLALVSPTTFSAIIDAFWFFMFSLVLIFLILGVLIMIGLKEQVRQIVDIFVEGTLSIVDIMNFLKMALKFILEILKQVAEFLVPIFAFLLGAAIYFGLIYLYKWVGKS